MNAFRPLVKICGVNDAAIAVLAERLGADFVGFVFAEKSPRYIPPHSVREIVKCLSGRAKRVGVFAGGTADGIAAAATAAGVDIVQIHFRDFGADGVRRLKSAGFGVWMLEGGDGAEESDAILFDGSDGARTGGTGLRADWNKAAAAAASGEHVVLAGGISAKNFSAAADTGAWVLDVNSSLETSPGVKSPALVEEIFRLRG